MNDDERPPSGHSALRTPHSARAFVALGSNVGDSRATLLNAMKRLQDLSGAPLWCSSLWETTPVNCPPGSPLFVNAVIALAPLAGETPESLIAKLQSLERESGRRPTTARNQPRPLDLDLIAWGGEVRATPQLTLPHPRAHLRRFVLQPLAEIAPGLTLPGQSRTVAELLDRLGSDEALRKLERS